MAKIHGISGCTKYLLNGTHPINGKKPATLEELHYLYDHYDEIIAETGDTIAREHDEIIFGLSNEESELDRRLQEGIEKQTREVDGALTVLHENAKNADKFFLKISSWIKFLVALYQRSHRIHSPYADLSRELKDVRKRKERHISNKDSLIRSECGKITGSYQFLEDNMTFLIGADGEELVIDLLSQLPDEYHVVNDVNLRFNDAIYWRQADEYIITCQIDHIVAGPTGIFLLETKNRKYSDIKLKSDELKHQVNRSSYALWYFLKDYYRKAPYVQKVIVPINGSSVGRKLDKYIDVVVPSRLYGYITKRDTAYSGDEIKRFVKLIGSDY